MAEPGVPPSPDRPSRRRLLTVGGTALAALALMVALDRVADYAARRWAVAQVAASAETAAALRVAVLRSEIDKQRSLPVVLRRRTRRCAARWRRRTRPASRPSTGGSMPSRRGCAPASSISSMPRATRSRPATTGPRRASSAPTTAFAPYFRVALAEGRAEHFAFGTVSRKPGLYLAQRVEAQGRVLGVLVLKAEFDALEAAWRRFAEPTFVTDERHIVLIASEPAFRFRTTVALDPVERDAIRESLQFGDSPLTRLDLGPSPEEGGVLRLRLPGRNAAQDFVAVDMPVPSTSWTLTVLAPTSATTRLATTAARASAALAGVVGLGSAGVWWTRRRRRARALAREAEARRALEARVVERTAELSAANAQLVTEMEERRRARLAFDALQDELVQASKLAVLGQIAAGVAHEVNQPVAAIRTFAENSRAFLDRGEPAAAAANLDTIAALTERIGAITGELRAFARKSAARIEPVALAPVIDGALLLMRYRLLQTDIALALDIDRPDVAVTGDRMRLEQVLVNLIQNAAEAIGTRRDGEIRIRVETRPDTVVVTVADNGPGLPEEMLGALFLPFTTTKPQGLGLGLVISKDIIAECGGSLKVENDGGAVFTVTLPRAQGLDTGAGTA